MVNTDDVFKKIEGRLAKIDPADRKVLHTYKFVLTDEAGKVTKNWMLDLKVVKIYVGNEEAECTLTLKESTLISIITGELDSTKALNDDLVDVDGNLELIHLLKPFISSV